MPSRLWLNCIYLFLHGSMHGHIGDPLFPILSLVVAVMGSWTALDLFRRVRANLGPARFAWLGAAALAMGLSIWSMHFVAMLGFDPGSPVRYDPWLTLLSLGLAVGGTGVAFFMGIGAPSVPRLLAAGTIMGLGISIMHYAGMAALRSAISFGYEPVLVALSILVGIVAATAALVAASRDRTVLWRAAAAPLLGVAIVSMHYTAMAAVRLGEIDPDLDVPPGLNPTLLAAAVAGGTSVLLFLALLASLFDRRFELVGSREARRNENQIRAILENLPIGIFVVDAGTGSIRFANPEAERLLRHRLGPEPLWSGAGQYGPIGEDDQPIPRESYALHEAISEGRTVGPRLQRYRRGDGSTTTVEVQATPIRDDHGHITGAISAFQDVTEKLAAESEIRRARALAESEERFRLVTEAAPVMLWMGDEQGRCLYLNRALREFWGVEDVSTFGWADTLLPEDAPKLFAVFSEAMERQVPFEVEARYRRADGEIRILTTQTQPRHDDEGRFLGMIGVNADVTEQRAAEGILRQSEAQFRTFAQAVPNHVWTAPPSGQIDWLNDRTTEYCGLSSGDLTGDGWGRIVHPDDLPHAAEAWRQSLETGSPYQVEFRLRRHDGAFRWFLARALPIRGEDGEITRWLGSNTDVEDQRSALAELERLKAGLEEEVARRTADHDRIWRLSQELMLVCGLDGVITSVNPAANRLLGWSEAELVGRRVTDFVHEEDIEKVAAELGRLAEGKTTFDFENRTRTKAGDYRLLDWTAVPAEGFIHAVGRDITAEREAARSLEAAQEQLRQSQKMEAVGQLTGGIAHDFNNLLQGITGSLDLLQKRISQGRTDDISRFVTGAMSSANRAAALTHRLLAFSRRQPLAPQPVKVNPLIASMEDMLRRSLGERIALELVLAGGLWTTRCDPNQLESAILNLSINARDAMPDGGKLTIETCNTHLDHRYSARHAEVQPGQYICIAVSDTGSGMDAETASRAFEPFFTTKPIGQGTGLGLSMIYGFARQSEGHCKIYSEVGRGTTVKVYLPRHVGESDVADDEIISSREDKVGEGETVLVVEDEPVVRSLVVDVLSDLGYRAVEAADGPAGLALLQSGRKIDLLITDVGLPGLNGRQLADAGRELRPDLKVLFMTGYAENAALASGFLEPGMELITKPFGMDALTDRIRGILEEG